MRIRGLRRFTSFIWQGESGSKGYKIRSGVEKNTTPDFLRKINKIKTILLKLMLISNYVVEKAYDLIVYL